MILLLPEWIEFAPKQQDIERSEWLELEPKRQDIERLVFQSRHPVKQNFPLNRLRSVVD